MNKNVACSVQNCQINNCKCNQTLQAHNNSLLSSFSDDEIAREHCLRMMRKLGDPRIGVTGYPQLGSYNTMDYLR